MPRPKDHVYWEKVHNTAKSNRAFILSTGPSIAAIDVEPLREEFTVGINHLYRWKGLPFIPSAWAACEYDDLYKVAGDIAHLKIPKWFAHPVWHTYNSMQPDFKPDKYWNWIHTDSHCNFAGHPPKWKGITDIMGLADEFWRVAVGYTPVLAPAIPALVWMGFREIYLLGVDHTEENHVYASDGQRNQLIKAANKSFATMVPELEKHGVVVRNCSPDSLAPVPYVPYEEVIGATIGGNT